MKKNGFAPLILILLIAILGVVGYFGYKNSLSKTAEVLPTPTQNPAIVNGLKTYSSSLYSLEFQYSQDLNIIYEQPAGKTNTPIVKFQDKSLTIDTSSQIKTDDVLFTLDLNSNYSSGCNTVFKNDSLVTSQTNVNGVKYTEYFRKVPVLSYSACIQKDGKDFFVVTAESSYPDNQKQISDIITQTLSTFKFTQ